MPRKRRKRTTGSRAFQKALRVRGMTMEEAAEILGVSYKSVQQWLYGERRPDLERASLLEAQFGVGMRLWLD